MRVLDTDTCIEILRGNGVVIARRESTPDDVGTTWVTASELYFGAARSSAPGGNRDLVDRFLQTLSVIDFDLRAARVFSATKAALRDAGQQIADADLFIASVVIARGATLVTGNRRHFERIPGIILEDWIR